MQITISVSHTFEDATLFAEFAPELKALLDKFFSGPASPPAAPETRGMTPRDCAAVIAPPAASFPNAEQPALSATASEESSDEVAQEAPAAVDVKRPPEPSIQPEVREGEDSAPADKPKRKRRTRAEMAAAREAGAVAPLPSAGSFGGPATVSAPQPVAAEPDPFDPFNPMTAAPAPKPAPTNSTVTLDDVKRAFSPILMCEDSEPLVLEVLGSHGLTQVRDSLDKPHLWPALHADFMALQRKLKVGEFAP